MRLRRRVRQNTLANFTAVVRIPSRNARLIIPGLEITAAGTTIQDEVVDQLLTLLLNLIEIEGPQTLKGQNARSSVTRC